MKKTFKILFNFFLIATICLSGFCINVFAASTSISFSSKSVTVGEPLTVEITFDAGEPMFSAICVVNYDSSILEYSSGSAVGGAGSVKITESPSNETKVTYYLKFKAIGVGTSTVSVVDANCGVQPGNNMPATNKGLSSSSASVSVRDVTLSANADLKSLRPTAGTLSPAFSPNTTNYNITVKNSITECRISAVTADSAAKFTIEGSSKLQIGKNVRTIIVTAPDGVTQKTYTLTITRSETDEEPTEETTEPTPLDTTIDGNTYTVATDISSVALFGGFTANTATFNGTDVAVATDGTYTLYYLKSADSENLIPYTLNEETNTFEKLQFLTQGDKTYIIASIPKGKTFPETYYNTNATINGMDIKCYADSNGRLNDFYYLYCYQDGAYNIYRYDSRENTLQRFPEIQLIEIEAKPILDKNANIIDKFNALTTNAKIIVICLIAVLLLAIALIVFVILKLVSKKNEEFFDENDGMSETDIFAAASINGIIFEDEEETPEINSADFEVTAEDPAEMVFSEEDEELTETEE